MSVSKFVQKWLLLNIKFCQKDCVFFKQLFYFTGSWNGKITWKYERHLIRNYRLHFYLNEFFCIFFYSISLFCFAKRTFWLFKKQKSLLLRTVETESFLNPLCKSSPKSHFSRAFLNFNPIVKNDSDLKKMTRPKKIKKIVEKLSLPLGHKQAFQEKPMVV